MLELSVAKYCLISPASRLSTIVRCIVSDNCEVTRISLSGNAVDYYGSDYVSRIQYTLLCQFDVYFTIVIHFMTNDRSQTVGVIVSVVGRFFGNFRLAVDYH